MANQTENFKFKKAGSTLFVSVAGAFNEEIGMAFINTYKQEVAGMYKKDELKMDCTQLKVTGSDILGMLEGCFNMYKQDFSKATMSVSDKNTILKMQLQRIARKVELDLSVDLVSDVVAI